jgi:transcriptional regulator with XRE-family HTH domain
MFTLCPEKCTICLVFRLEEVKMDNLQIEIGQKLWILRDELGISLRDVAAKTGVSKSTIDQYEKGNVDQKIGALRKLAAFYNVDIKWLIGETEERR